MVDKKKSNIDLKELSGALVSSFVSEYLETVMTNILNKEDDILKDNTEFTDYFVATITPVITLLYEDKLSDELNILFSIILYYVLTKAVNVYLKNEEINGGFLVFDIIMDYLVILFLDKIFKLFTKDSGEFDKGTVSMFLEDFSFDTAVSLHYSLKSTVYSTDKLLGCFKKNKNIEEK